MEGLVEVIVTWIEKGERGWKSLLGMTKSGTSVKGEMRLVPKPDGTCGGLKPYKPC